MLPENDKFSMKTLILFTVMLGTAGLSAYAQGTLIYDQQSSDKTWPSIYRMNIQSGQPLGQSFVPSLSSIDFIQLYVVNSLSPVGPGPRTRTTPDATVYVNLWAGSIGDGVLLASTLPVFLSGGAVNFADPFSPSGAFAGVTNFFFPTPVTLIPGTTYYFQPVVEPGAGAVFVVMTDSTRGADAYPNGMGFFDGTSHTWDLWFAEGIVATPEPAAGWLILMGAIFLCQAGCKRICR
jgi:hypothetical protein